jgi:hypothetical protein
MRKIEQLANRFAILALWVPTAPMALPAQTVNLTQAADEIRSIRLRLEERNAAIRTAHLELRFDNVDFDGTKGDGRVELYFDGANYLQRLHVGGAVLVELEKDGSLYSHTIDPDGNPTRVSTRDARGSIERSFWSLLPSLTPEPANLVERESTVPASEDHLKIAQTGNVFWIDRETGDVVRMERSDAVAEYGSFVVRDGLRFPTRISTRTVATGEVVTLEVNHVEINGPVDPALFATPDPPGHP